MGEHKTNPNSADPRPRCGTCDKFIPAQGNTGTCHALPPTCFAIPSQNKLTGQTTLQPISYWTPAAADKAGCSQHPDFMRWSRENKDRWVQVGELEVTA